MVLARCRAPLPAAREEARSHPRCLTQGLSEWAAAVRPAGVTRRRASSSVDLDVDPLLRVLQEAAFAPRAHGKDLGEDRERRLLLRVGADVEAAGPHDPLQRLLLDARLEQPLAPALLVPARAERADVERLGPESPEQRGLVELVVVGEDDDRGLVVG